uniref:rRNA intron-encoded homing endonuclease n=1 Tax=Solanum tuberosum TaxID=4113 RepID=M1DUP9_SOLTU
MTVALALDLTMPERACQAHAARVVIEECYLVDPATSHMVVLKIKPCICVHRSSRPFCRRCAPGLNWPGRASGAVTLKKLECSKQAYALYTLAWDNIIGFRRTTAKAFAKDVFINQERKLGARRRSDTVLVSTINDADQGSADVAFRTPPAPYEKSKFLGSGGSMVARLKLKGIDGRAPPGVEPAA